jgi:hypothetical protein
LIIADIIVETLRDMDLKYPKLDAERKRELAKARELLTASNKSREKVRGEVALPLIFGHLDKRDIKS